MSWSFVAQQRTPVHGGRDFPSVRYSASAVAYKGEMIVTHGYFYNHAIRHPAWQSNAWAFNFASRTWRKVHEGEGAGAPSARYSASAVLYDHALWMFGGDDGGHKKSMFNYIFQAWFDEMWRLDLRTYVWHKVRPRGAAPPKRALHGAVVVGESMYLYGGLELADTWRYDFKSSTWQLLVPPPANTDVKDDSHPGRRHAFAAAASPGGMYIFGGCRHVKGMRPLAFNDLWHFSIAANAWKRLAPSPDMPIPKPRSHLSLVPLTDHIILLYGGATCVPGCVCHGDTWTYDDRTGAWELLNATNAPIHRYRQSLVVSGEEGALYLYGGESYQPYMYHNAVNRLQLPPAISREMIAYARVGVGGGGGGGKGGGGKGGKRFFGGRMVGERSEDAEPIPAAALSSALGLKAARGTPESSQMLNVLPAALVVVGAVVMTMRAVRARRASRHQYEPVGAP